MVTGVTGYVGREVVQQLLANGKSVTALGRSQPEEDIPFIQADLTKTDGLKQTLEGKSFDCITASRFTAWRHWQSASDGESQRQRIAKPT